MAKPMDDPLSTHTHTHPTPVDCLWLPPPVDVVDVSLCDPILLVVGSTNALCSLFLCHFCQVTWSPFTYGASDLIGP